MLSTEGILCQENTDCIKGIIKILKRIKKFLKACLIHHRPSPLMSVSPLCADGVLLLGLRNNKLLLLDNG